MVAAQFNGRRLSERRGSATDAQRQFVRRLANEAFVHRFGPTGVDVNHLETLSASEASSTIDYLKIAKAAGWPKCSSDGNYGRIHVDGCVCEHAPWRKR